jgi:hypothetical protein
MLLVLALSPEAWGRSESVATGVHEKLTQDGGLSDSLGEAGDIGRVIQVVPLPVNSHHEMMTDDCLGQSTFGGSKSKAGKHGLGLGRPALGMTMDALGLTHVMEQ